VYNISIDIFWKFPGNFYWFSSFLLGADAYYQNAYVRESLKHAAIKFEVRRQFDVRTHKLVSIRDVTQEALENLHVLQQLCSLFPCALIPRWSNWHAFAIKFARAASTSFLFHLARVHSAYFYSRTVAHSLSKNHIFPLLTWISACRRTPCCWVMFYFFTSLTF
jgi:hypothetical protein